MESSQKLDAAREARLHIAVEIAASEKPLCKLQAQMLRAMSQADPVVKNVLRVYKPKGVEIE